MYQKILSILMVLLIIVFSFSSYAEQDDALPYASELIATYTVGISKSGSTLKATPNITATSVADQIGFSTLKFQKYTDGEWITVKTISAVYKYNATAYSTSLTYVGESGEKYRAVCTFYVRNGVSSDTRTRTSNSITL